MPESPLLLGSYPRAILHLDGDAFFTSVEQALNPALRNRPVVTGKERGIIACASYEAKALGIKRGIPLFAARRICPNLAILPDDYETYSLFSKRMFEVMRRYSPWVEEYSVDEGFVDLTGMRRVFRCSYEAIAKKLQADIHKELGITVSAGLSLSKGLAKLCSKFRKPAGFTAVPGPYIHLLLQRTPLERVWGFGPGTVELLTKHGLQTAYDFVLKPEPWAGALLGKPGRELWSELRGASVWKVTPEPKTTYATILKSKTFTPASDDPSFVFARLVRNVESAFMKARRYRLRPASLGVVLRHHDFRHEGMEARLTRATSSTLEVLPLIRRLFDASFRPGSRYRATLVVLGRLEEDRTEQYDLFEDRPRIETLHRLTLAMDAINRRYGKHAIGSATALFLDDKRRNDRDEPPPRREEILLPGETVRQRLAIPRLSLAC